MNSHSVRWKAGGYLKTKQQHHCHQQYIPSKTWTTRARYCYTVAQTQPAKMGWICCHCSTANTSAAFTCTRCKHAGDCCVDCYSYSRRGSTQEGKEDGVQSPPEESPVGSLASCSPSQEKAGNKDTEGP